MFALQLETMMVIPARGMAGKRTQTIEANMATREADTAILQDLVLRMDGIHIAKTQFGATMMMRTSE